jgi:hypothetical protein
LKSAAAFVATDQEGICEFRIPSWIVLVVAVFGASKAQTATMQGRQARLIDKLGFRCKDSLQLLRRTTAMRRALRNTVTASILVITVILGQRILGQTGGATSSGQVPIFQIDPTWLKVPENWTLGQGSAVAVDKHDNVWILHRPRYVGRLYEKPAGKTAAPPVLEFDSSGKFIQAWGGPGDG